MQLTFPGTRGSGSVVSPRHVRHSILLVTTPAVRLLIDCGSDWPDAVERFTPDAILLTHAHADHTGGLSAATAATVWGTTSTRERLPGEPPPDLRTAPHFTSFALGDLTLQAVPVAHSRRAPAVAYRISATDTTVFYCPDVADLAAPATTLAGVDLFIGDGSATGERLLRREAGALCGHAPLSTQLEWCATAQVPRVLFTHLGEEMTLEAESIIIPQLRERGAALGMTVDFAYDGLCLTLDPDVGETSAGPG